MRWTLDWIAVFSVCQDEPKEPRRVDLRWTQAIVHAKILGWEEKKVRCWEQKMSEPKGRWVEHRVRVASLEILDVLSDGSVPNKKLTMAEDLRAQLTKGKSIAVMAHSQGCEGFDPKTRVWLKSGLYIVGRGRAVGAEEDPVAPFAFWDEREDNEKERKVLQEASEAREKRANELNK
jgi:hypothetical protein